MKTFSLSRFTIIIALAISLIVSSNNQKWKQGVIQWDIISYYAYLPGAFIYNDLSFKFIEGDPFFGDKIWMEQTPDNRKVDKMTSGLSVMYAPFFFTAHTIAKLFPEQYPPDGYSMIYSLFLILSDIFYTMIGLVFMRKILLRYFSDSITAITILAVFFGTNMFYYSMYEVMSHCYLFCLIAMFLYYTIEWYENPKKKYTILLGLLLGLITLTRPINGLVIIVWFLYDVYSIQGIKQRVVFLWANRKTVIPIAILSFLVCSIQLMYWKYSTGHWIYWSYTDEGFFWSKPHIWKGLVGFRKGWYIYTPVMLFGTAGLILTYKYLKQFFLAFTVFFCLFTYVVLSWWCWWYGGGLCIRPMIDIYAIMGVGLAVSLQYIYEMKQTVLRYASALLFTLFILYGLFVNAQYHFGALHYDSMTFTSWKINFLKIIPQAGYYESLSTPDYEKAMKQGEE